MAASVQELLLAAQAKAPQRSPLVQVVEQALGGYDQGQQDRLNHLSMAKKMLEIEQAKQEKLAQEKMALEMEKDLREAHASTATPGTPATPSSKFKREWTKDEKGKISSKITAVEPPAVKTPTSIEEGIMARVNSGEITLAEGIDLKHKASTTPKVGDGMTVAQKKVDQMFGSDYTKYVAGGGYADAIGQIQTLEGVYDRLLSGKENLTGPVLSMQPDFTRKRLNPASMEAQQAVEQSVQRTLKQTLGGQFTEREGVLFMQRGYDPALTEAQNAEKLKRAITQLKSMALAKQAAVDYYEENGTLQGFKGTFYTLKDGEMVQATKDDFYKMMGGSPVKDEEKPSTKTPQGKIAVSNGKETLFIDPSDEQDALNDGYKRVQ